MSRLVSCDRDSSDRVLAVSRIGKIYLTFLRGIAVCHVSGLVLDSDAADLMVIEHLLNDLIRRLAARRTDSAALFNFTLKI